MYDNTLNAMTASHVLPNNQPFNIAPYNYMGSENFSGLAPLNAIDWVLVEVRSGLDNMLVIEQQAALVFNDGTVANPDSSALRFYNLMPNEQYYVAIKTRNHLAVISQNPLNLPNNMVLDFSDATMVLGGVNQLTMLSNGSSYALKAGDFNSDGIISVADFNLYTGQSGNINQYNHADCNADNTVSVADFNLYRNNVSSIGMSPIRY